MGSYRNFLIFALNQYQFLLWPDVILYDFLRSAPTSVVFIGPLDGTRFGPQEAVRAQLLHKNQAEDAAQEAVSEWSGAFPFLFPKFNK